MDFIKKMNEKRQPKDKYEVKSKAATVIVSWLFGVYVIIEVGIRGISSCNIVRLGVPNLANFRIYQNQ